MSITVSKESDPAIYKQFVSWALSEWPDQQIFWVAHGKSRAFWFPAAYATNIRRWWMRGLHRRYDLWLIFHGTHRPTYAIVQSRVADAEREEKSRDVILVPIWGKTVPYGLATQLLVCQNPLDVLSRHSRKAFQPHLADASDAGRLSQSEHLADDHTDGPKPPRYFTYNGTTIEIIEPRLWKACAILWPYFPSRACPVDDFTKKYSDKKKKPIGRKGLTNLLLNLSDALEHRIAFSHRAITNGDYIDWEEIR